MASKKNEIIPVMHQCQAHSSELCVVRGLRASLKLNEESEKQGKHPNNTIIPDFTFPGTLYILSIDNTMERDFSGIRQNLDILSRTIAETVPVDSIYLFGSYAYGTPSKDSDLDIYIVFKDEMQMRELDALAYIRLAILPIKKMPMDILGLKKNRFDDMKLLATLERKIAREGIKLYG